MRLEYEMHYFNRLGLSVVMFPSESSVTPYVLPHFTWEIKIHV